MCSSAYGFATDTLHTGMVSASTLIPASCAEIESVRIGAGRGSVTVEWGLTVIYLAKL